MATPTAPVTTEPAGALFRALRSAGVEADLAYRADDEIRAQAGHNVITAIGAQITELKALIDAQGARIEAQGARIDAQTAKIDAQGVKIDAQTTKIDAQGARIEAEIKAQTVRIDVLQRVIWRVIWPLIVLLAAPIFGLLYKALTAPGG